MSTDADASTSVLDCVARKKALRTWMQQTLSRLPDEELETQSRKAVSNLLALPQYAESKAISVYMSMSKGELRTEKIVRHALRSGKKVYIPYIYKCQDSQGRGSSSIMDMLLLRDEADYASLAPDRWGIPSIQRSSVDDRMNCMGGKGLTEGKLSSEGFREGFRGLETIIVPGVAFDTNMNRLGHGKGYYDDFIRRYHAQASAETGIRNKVVLIGLALNDQVLCGGESVPVTSNDAPMDFVITGEAVYTP